MTYFWGEFPFVDSIQGDERERLLKLCKTKPVDYVAYGDGFVVVRKGHGKGMEESIREYERLQMEQPLLDVSTEELGARLHELVRLSNRMRANSDGSIEIALPRAELAVLAGIAQWQSFWRLPGRLLLRWFILLLWKLGIRMRRK